MSKSASKIQSHDTYLDDIVPCWETLQKIINKHPKYTFKFFETDKNGWILEINSDLLGLPKETTMSSLYKE